MNRELAIQMARFSNTLVSFFVPKCNCCDEDKREASNYNVKIVDAEERPGYEPIDWLTTPPEDLLIDFVVGHGVILGKQAQFIRKSHQCKWIQVVHTAPDELAVYKEYSGAITKGEEKQSVEFKLCEMADIVVAVGPKLTEFYTGLLNFCGKKVYNFTPGIFNQFANLKVSSIQRKKFRILVLGRGDTEDFKLKGYDIAAQAVAQLLDKTYHLMFVGASRGSQSHVNEELLKYGLSQKQLIVKGYLEKREDLIPLLCFSNLVIIPSRTEGFGLTALEALSAGIPFLVSQNSGFAEALQDIKVGSAFIVDSEDPEPWAEAIKATREKGSERAFQECQELRTLYAEKYSWQRQCEELLSVMMSLINGDRVSCVITGADNHDKDAVEKQSADPSQWTQRKKFFGEPLFNASFQRRSQSSQPVTHTVVMFQPKAFRENSDLVRLQGQGSWSQWMRAMVPSSHGSYTENRGPGQPGYMWSNIKNELNGVAGLCGIYEFQVRGTLPHHLQSALVYVGSTCWRQADGGQCRRLNSRIINYCRHGSHKADLINYALRSGYELWVRYKQAGSVEQAQAWENTLLAMYDYAWNVRNNGSVRAVP